jgi:DNA-binding transcriptional MerR regulator
VKEAIFIGLLKAQDKAAALREAVRALRAGQPAATTHTVAPESFQQIPGSPFAYWVSKSVRRVFSQFSQFEDGNRVVRQGLATADDFRFLRLWIETSPLTAPIWPPFAKGGEYSPFYFDLPLAINWKDSGASLKAQVLQRYGSYGKRVYGELFYFRPGLTWPLRAAAFSPQARPAGSIFSVRGYSIISENDSSLDSLIGFCSSRIFDHLFKLLLGRDGFPEFIVGILQRLPVPDLSGPGGERLAALAREAVDLKRDLDTVNETSHVFVLPVLLRVRAEALAAEPARTSGSEKASDPSVLARGDAVAPREERERTPDPNATHREPQPVLASRLAAWNERVASAARRLEKIQREIDDLCFDLYGITDADRKAVEEQTGTEVKGLPEPLAADEAASALVSWAVGCALGRFDLRLATGARPLPVLSDPFAPLPSRSPGSLEHGSSGPAGLVPDGYPLRVDADGILVEDEGHEDDLAARLLEVLRLAWGPGADALEAEICEALGAKSLRDYLRKPGKGGFWDAHVARYSKSRRKAPIWWLLQSPRKSASVWLDYHRADKDTLHKVLGKRYLGGRIEGVKHQIAELRPGGKTKDGISKKEEKRLAELDSLLTELEDFAAQIRAVVELKNERGQVAGWDPDLDDGVVLNAAPLHALIPWPAKKKHRARSMSELEVYWHELTEGKYDWAHIAMRYWPDRVTEKCKTDKSLAIAHDLDGQFFPGLREELRRKAEKAAAEPEPDEQEVDTTDEDEPEE